MIVHYAQGGLGNQLFNYAAARSLADRVKTELLIDAESYRGQWGEDAQRPFLLNRFPVRAAFRNLGSYRDRLPLKARLYRRLTEDFFYAEIERPSNEIAFFAEFEKLGKNVVLKGHFIDYRFFSWNKERLIQDLTLSMSLVEGDSRGERLLAEIQSAECAIAVHVRRGDLLDKENRWLLLDGVEQYYRKAMDVMLSRYPGANFFLFSDDLSWCEREFRDDAPRLRIVDAGINQARDVLIDFCLMANCKHNIIANSAFSW